MGKESRLDQLIDKIYEATEKAIGNQKNIDDLKIILEIVNALAALEEARAKRGIKERWTNYLPSSSKDFTTE